MCGIVGYTGYRSAVPILLKGLEHLEYRGYDSAGIAYLSPSHQIQVVREKGKVAQLKAEFAKGYPDSKIGIGHTRWATHGEPSARNAHPHQDFHKQIAFVHNGIVENYLSIKEELQRNKISFSSDTDTEVAANLIGYHYRKSGDLIQAMRISVQKMQGCFAFAILSTKEPNKLIAFKRSNPLVVGLGKGENFLASDVPAFLSYTQRVLYLEDDEYVVMTPQKVEIFSLVTGKQVHRKPSIIAWSMVEAKKGGYAHFMLKEIYEQPGILKNLYATFVDAKRHIHFEKLNTKVQKRLLKVKKVFLVSCGTAYHASVVGTYMIEQCARISCETQVASEFRYRNPVVSEGDLVILITQSGETADTLAALREAKSRGAFTLAMVNVVGSTIAREADFVIYTHAGPEIGVASTKAYTAQLMTLTLFAAFFGLLRKKFPQKDAQVLIAELKRLPDKCAQVLKLDKAIEICARKYLNVKNFLYLGRGVNYPTALEGALKLKEISYAHAHGYAAGEMKHGPIALIDSSQPVLCIAPASRTYEKMLSNIEEIRAREGIAISIGTDGDKRLEKLSSYFFPIPEALEMITPLLTVLPLQLFAYRIALMNGRDVDKPRNLAKSVTVE
ncbi:MAG: glutamine--fructose-6-phosphate transaminase (isomerizing) [Candidatus Omnitrophica bacterium]|nr:glutamine--fructose-6-phosphate transaminase (isomerizing) [Candidatus Omnitrophota bacterium]